MNKVVLSCFLLLSVSSALHAASKSEAVTIAKEYSGLVACMIPESNAGYYVVEVEAGMDDSNDGAVYLVHWQGDTGCHKGSGTVRSNYTVVADTVGSGPMLVTQNMVDQGFGVSVLNSITVNNGLITIEGTVPGETKWDQKEVSYKLKYKWGDFTVIE